MRYLTALARVLAGAMIFITSMADMNISAATPGKVTPPDFAFPVNVADASKNALDSLLSEPSADGQQALRQLIDYATARMLITNDNISSVCDDISVVEARLASPQARAVADILEADILSKYYSSSRDILNSRNTPAGARPRDIAQWSGAEFRSRIRELINAALSHSVALASTPVTDYSSVIEADDLTRIYYPTLLDFVGSRAIDILSATAVPDDSKNAALSKKILESLIALHASDTAPLINYTLRQDEDKNTGYLMDLYRRYSSSDFSGQILSFANRNLDHSAKVEYVDALRSNISRFPNFWVTNDLKNILSDITAGSVNAVITMAHPIPGKEFDIQLHINNVNTVEVNFYSVPASSGRSIAVKNIPVSSKKPVKFTYSNSLSVPFELDTVVKAMLPASGYYAMVVCGKGDVARSDNSVPVIEVSGIYGIELQDSESSRADILALDAFTGAPRSNIDVNFTYSEWSRGKSTLHTTPIGRTDKDGLVRTPERKDNNRWGTYILSDGSDKTSFSGQLPAAIEETPARYARLTGYTDRPIYHPGDEVRFAFVVTDTKGNEHRLMSPGRNITVRMRNANHQEVDTLTLSTDEFGRIAGSMLIPSAGLTGSFSLIAEVKDGTRTLGTGYAGFTVSDYKLPTFLVDVTSVKRDFPSEGDVTIGGNVSDFTGFPVSGASLTVKLSTAPRFRWWWGQPAATVCVMDTVADAQGKFSITFDASRLSGAKDFCATIDATSSAGETRSATKFFTTGKPYIINFSTGTNIDASSPVDLHLSVLDDEYKALPGVGMTYSLTSSEGNPPVTGTFTSSDAVINLGKVKAGRYKLEICTADTALAMPVSSDIVIYRPSDSKVAVNLPLWIPQTTISFTGGKARLLYGVSEGKSMIYILSKAKGLSDFRHIEANAGYHYLDITNPAPEAEELSLTIFTVREGQCHSYSVTVKNPQADNSIVVGIESFRDRLVPGTEEIWNFKVKSAHGQGVKSALILDVYNSALAQLVPFAYHTPDFPRTAPVYFSLNFDSYTPSVYWASSRSDRMRVTTLVQPSFIDYGQNFGFMHQISMRLYKSMNAAPMMMARAGGVNDFAADDAVLEEAAVETTSVSYDDSDTGRDEITPEMEYRPSELPVIMFRPLLTTDADGVSNLSFTVPNANASWEMLLVAYTDNLRSAMMSKSFVTSKPVMVTPNLPRFLRTGDSAIIPATVKNNTDSTVNVDVTVELFNPTDGKIYSSMTRSRELAPMSSDTVNLEATASADMNMLGYRVKAISGRFSDGEQNAIPVLPSVEPVFESKTFFLSPEDKTYTLTVPKLSPEASATLLFCDNPSWWVVSALPGLRKDIGSNANSAAAAIFSAAVATHIIDENPAVAAALREWQANPSDSMLVSMLQKNAELKTVLLTSTPWVSAAESDSERMTRLALLFDKKEVASTISQATEVLTKLSAESGGWMWYAGASRPSTWVTENVLGMMGHLRSLGITLPPALDRMTDDALVWLDNEMVESYRKSSSAAGYISYACIRSMFSSPAPSTAASALLSKVREYLVAHWKDLSLENKPAAAILLYKGGYQRVAGKVLESMRQYSRRTPEKGMWFPSLDDTKPWWPMTKNIVTANALTAFSTVEPGCKDAEYLAQWLVMQKEGQNWGTSVATTQVISSLLEVGRLPLSPSGNVNITLDGKEVTPSRIDRLTGDFKLSLMPYSPSEKDITISRTGGTQASGALITITEADPTEVKASSCEALSIEKTLQRRIVTPEGFAWEEATSLSTGDRVQVTLLVRATRDLQYVSISDNRAAAFEPVDQLPGYVASEGVFFYRENRDAATNLSIEYLPAGTYLLTYELNVNTAGKFTSGLATIQSQYSPAVTAHSSGTMFEVQ